MKKLLTMMMCGAVLLAGAGVSANAAAAEINDNEQKILDYMTQGADVAGDTYRFDSTSDEYITMYEYFNTAGVDLSVADADAIISSAKQVATYITENAEKTMSVEVVDELIAMSKPAMDVLGFTIKYNAATDSITILDKDGNVLNTMEGVIGIELGGVTPPADVLENTGENFSSSFIIFGLLSAVLLGAGFVATRKQTQA